jgi:hypothetical protein
MGRESTTERDENGHKVTYSPHHQGLV